MVFLLGFQDSATPVMEGIVDLHNHIFFFLVLVLFFVCWMFFNIVYNFWFLAENPSTSTDIKLRKVWLSLRNYTHGTAIEIIWTLIPSGILVMIAIPSFALLYSMDEVNGPAVTLKVLGHQWYWSYEYSDYSFFDEENNLKNSIEFDSYMVPTEDLAFGEHRLLEVDNQVVLPTNVHVRVIISAVDVLHSWSVNALGIKVDAVPGRLNQSSFFIKREGTYYGQCSELCGVNHGFMPIVVKAVSLANYKTWLLAAF